MAVAVRGTRTGTNQLGPYERWMFDAGKYYDLPALMLSDQVNLSGVAEFASAIPCAQITQISGATEAGAGRFRVHLPTLYRPQRFASRFVPFLMCPKQADAAAGALFSHDAKAVADLLASFRTGSESGSKSPGNFRINFPVRGTTIDRCYPSDPAPYTRRDGRAAPSAIVAIIDLGIPFAHANFRHSDGHGTRIDYCWSQTAPADNSGRVLFGREFTNDQIDDMVERHGGDEDAIYRDAKLLTRRGEPPMPLDRMHSHGAHVLDAFAGNWPMETESQVRIIAVDLPASSTWDTSGYGTDMFMLAAMHYILERAKRISDAYGLAELPLVINLSYGISGGSHDGGSLIEDAFDELVTERSQRAPTALVMPSGNMFQDRLNALITEQHFGADANGTTKTATLQWFAPPDDRTSSYIELWYPKGTDCSDISVGVYPPNACSPANTVQRGAAMIQADPSSQNLLVDGRIVGQFSIDKYRDRRWRVMVILAPTEPSWQDPANPPRHAPPDLHAAPPGNWTLKFIVPINSRLPDPTPVSGSLPVGGGIQCRIQRDTSYGQGNTGARQSYFVDPMNARYGDNGGLAEADQPLAAVKVRRFGSLNGMASAASTLVVAGHMASTLRPAFYSSAGAMRLSAPASGWHPVDKQVQLSAPTERSQWAPGIVAAGTRSGITVALRGTSSAAPQAARALAMAFLTGTNQTATDVSGFMALLQSTVPAAQAIETGGDPATEARSGQLRL